MTEQESDFENSMLQGMVVVDAFLMLQSRLTPEEFLDLEIEKMKKGMLERFYERFPGQRKEG